jgi:hypothetical protein
MVNRIFGFIAFAVIILLVSAIACDQSSELPDTWTRIFPADRARFSDMGINPCFNLTPGYYVILEGEEDGESVKLIVTVLDENRMVDGIKTRIVEERELVDGKLMEVSRNYFAMDTITNSVFYFGEEVDIYRDGELVGHEGAWESGKDGAKFGLMMPGIILLGARYYQEIAPGEAMDRAEIVSMTESLKTPAGEFSGCVKIEETTPLEPGVKEYKFYYPGIGLIRDSDLVLTEYGTKD